MDSRTSGSDFVCFAITILKNNIGFGQSHLWLRMCEFSSDSQKKHIDSGQSPFSMESLKNALIMDSHTSGSEFVPVQQMSLRKALILENHRFNKSLTQKH